MRILGIDPGSLVTGFGIIDSDGRSSRHVHSGCIRVSGQDLVVRLGMIFEQVSELVDTHGPDVLSIEQVFVSRNPASALKLGQARGAAICAGVRGGLPVVEYSPASIKQAVVGTGSANKEQVQHMITMILGLDAAPASDAADALAVAVCHAHTQGTFGRLPEGVQALAFRTRGARRRSRR
ncbi:crossover junction endodeoxyribonuclease RuvC [Thioalkalivibrio denitrificans]|uniref:Crossover junction endodeoxyribonuclease RuvC n=1 Tax=Thioalkalivibrio denitrificans TaxID=108003 RepID=A0A1V3NKN1_9GAMM|nr:crossover junction endodeoxyribonuclease RuvC [Thioalkalivibrio denitrificans]OOG25610.1 crossover junction endodeoxyribonuclease RuvC [Thioalkalivibrio denitrificans]